MELLTSVIFGNVLVSLLSKVSSHPARPPLSTLATDHTGQMPLRPSADENKKYILNSSGLWLHIPHSSFLCGSHLPYAVELYAVAYRWVCCEVQWVQGEQPSWFSEFSAGGWLAGWLAGWIRWQCQISDINHQPPLPLLPLLLPLSAVMPFYSPPPPFSSVLPLLYSLSTQHSPFIASPPLSLPTYLLSFLSTSLSSDFAAVRAHTGQ